MGLLDHLWDDTLAGPPPETGLGKLRKHHTFNFRSTHGKDSGGVRPSSYSDESVDEATRVTRSIMIVKPPGYPSVSPPVSPAGSTPPLSPFSGGRDQSFLLRRRSMSDAYGKERRPASVPSTSCSSYDM